MRGYEDRPANWIDIMAGCSQCGAWAWLEFIVPGNPAPQGDLAASRYSGKLYHKSKRLQPWRDRVASQAGHAMQNAGFRRLGGPVAVEMRFVLYRPKALPKTRPTPPAIKKPDTDKLGRAILDALTGTVWNDDSQVVALRAYKRIADVDETPGCVIRVHNENVCATTCRGIVSL